MNPTESNALHFLHVLAAIVLAGFTHQALAASVPENRKRVMIWTGLASLVMLLTGIRMWQALYSFSALGWIIVKLVCWLGLSALSGLAFRLQGQTGLLAKIALALVAVAVAMVYFKPF